MRSAGKVIVVDDLESNVAVLRRLLQREGYTVLSAADGAAALDLVAREMPDLVLSDVIMPGMDGYELCRRVKEQRATRLTPVVLVTALSDREARLEGINAGADDFLTKPVDVHELTARVRSLVRLKRFTDDLDSAESVILSLGLTVEARDAYTVGHCERMARYAAAFGAHLELSEEEIGALHRGGYLHDVGKIGVPDAILSKPTPLTPEEYDTIKRHTTVGESLCGDLRFLRLVRPIVRHHHERWDGSGYPDGLAGDAIPLLAQITAIVDVYDALTTERVYRKPIAPDRACAELRTQAQQGRHRRDLVEKFITICNRDQLPPRLNVRPFAATMS